MANSTQSVTSDGTLVLIDISFDYINRNEVSVFFDSVLTTDWSWVGDNEKKIAFSPAVPVGVEVLVKRTTDISGLRHEFSLGAAFTYQTLDEGLKQVLHIAQEASEANFSGDFFVPINMHTNRITDLAPGVATNDAVTVGQLQPFATAAEVAAGGASDSAASAALSAAQAASSAAEALASADIAAGVGAAALADLAAPGGADLVGFTPAGTGAVATTVQAKLRETLSIEDFGAVGDGVTDDTAAFIAAATWLRTLGGGTLHFKAGATYFVLPTGGSAGAKLLDLQGCVGVTLEGNGARILTGSVVLPQYCVDLNATTDVVIRNMRFESSYAVLAVNDGIDWIIARQGAKRIILQNIVMTWGRIGFAAQGAAVGQGNDTDRARDIDITNLAATGTYYPMLFQGAGDNVNARNIVTRNCGRSYFAYNCKNHDVWLDSQAGGPFSDVLLKVYGSTNFYSRLENIKLSYSSPRRFPGSGNQGVDEAMVAMDFQIEAVNPAPCFIQNIDVQFDVEAFSVDQSQSLFIVRKYDAAGAADATQRNHQLIGLKLSGVGRSLQNLLSDGIRLFTRGGENWTGEFIDRVVVQDLNLATLAGQTAVGINGAGITGQCLIDRVYSAGLLSRAGTNARQLGIRDSIFANFTSRTQAPQTYAPAWTATTNPAIGNGTLRGSYTVDGNLCTVNIEMIAGSTTTFGTGNWAFSLPLRKSDDVDFIVGAAFGFDAGTGFYPGACLIESGTTVVRAVLGNLSANFVNGTVPMTWAANDYLKLTITYPIA